MLSLARIALVAIAGVMLVATPVGAQEAPSEEQRAAARRAFEAGLRAARAGDWELALSRFERAYQIVPAAGVLINVAGAQRQLGQTAAAVRTYERFLIEATEGPGTRHRVTAERELAVLEPRVGRLTLVVPNLAPDDRVRVGNYVVPHDEFREVAVDPGTIEATLTRGGSVVATASAEVSAGERVAVELNAPAVVPSAEETARESFVVPPPVAPIERDDGGVLSSPVFWIVAAAVVIGGAVAAILLVTSGDDPYSGNFGPGRVEVP